MIIVVKRNLLYITSIKADQTDYAVEVLIVFVLKLI